MIHNWSSVAVSKYRMMTFFVIFVFSSIIFSISVKISASFSYMISLLASGFDAKIIVI